ncbi:MAG: Putative hemolysin [uncultured Thiotrichaceae bacterium]|uniref:L-ornithine N(alpha)-acyltransferase n=1 Tax=uncultured Thiotrichaceae bacterium TaxID=298394 RepID=A0A6S6TSA6_9GAMM|nr:MAG: Putative hemolysin [uncultured Thiotrichaceae bacterium]
MRNSSKQIQPSLIVELAHTQEDIETSQRLRYQIFAEEQGAQLSSANQNLDKDFFDPYCHHLVVKERETNKVVGSTRILTDLAAKSAGGFYSQHEFDLNALLPLKGNVIEIGRTCIHKDYRKRPFLLS